MVHPPSAPRAVMGFFPIDIPETLVSGISMNRILILILILTYTHILIHILCFFRFKKFTMPFIFLHHATEQLLIVRRRKYMLLYYNQKFDIKIDVCSMEVLLWINCEDKACLHGYVSRYRVTVSRCLSDVSPTLPPSVAVYFTLYITHMYWIFFSSTMYQIMIYLEMILRIPHWSSASHRISLRLALNIMLIEGPLAFLFYPNLFFTCLCSLLAPSLLQIYVFSFFYVDSKMFLS